MCVGDSRSCKITSLKCCRRVCVWGGGRYPVHAQAQRVSPHCQGILEGLGHEFRGSVCMCVYLCLSMDGPAPGHGHGHGHGPSAGAHPGPMDTHSVTCKLARTHARPHESAQARTDRTHARAATVHSLPVSFPSRPLAAPAMPPRPPAPHSATADAHATHRGRGSGWTTSPSSPRAAQSRPREQS